MSWSESNYAWTIMLYLFNWHQKPNTLKIINPEGSPSNNDFRDTGDDKTHCFAAYITIIFTAIKARSLIFGSSIEIISRKELSDNCIYRNEEGSGNII